ncbi:hypothetical protein EJ04DRAFT_442691 [Polyplosphaeria fusca]|uniref:Uncharacterized protein n=1 Tax=Polyplosphaeria fusca TaxID=682080 RepID=A0A9P4QVC3_9PLEO|nr:hypothetical protein EJ04DRAFT_442691 [Polyplosphaeria fusca]
MPPQFGVPAFSNSSQPPKREPQSTSFRDEPDFIDLTGDDYSSLDRTWSNGTDGQRPADPFPELARAYMHDQVGPASAFNQDFMTDNDLAHFLLTPTQPGGYGPQQSQPLGNQQGGAFHQPALLQPSVGGFGSRPIPHLIPSRPPEWLRDESDDEDVVTPLDAASGGHIQKLIEGIKPDEDTVREPTPKSMSCELMEHQKIGLAWLRQMEEGSSKGGILADEMGLGKTIQALALILARKPDDLGCKTTLIVAPVALMRQWEKEIERHVRPGDRLKVFMYHGKKATFDRLRQYDVVLCTFGALQTEMKRIEKGQDNRSLSLLGPHCKWYRVIIDEAQCLKNRNTLTSKASNELHAQYRLVMTGTPMMNSIDELYPLLRFLHIRPYNDWGKFNWEIAKPVKNSNESVRRRGMDRLHVLLKSTMLRRRKDTPVDGRPICSIPPKHTHEAHVELSDDEFALYKAIETKSQLRMNKYLKAGTVSNNYANMLVLLLRLRQACCHPHLIKDLGVQASTEGIAEDDLKARAEQLSTEVVNRLKDQDGFECPICLDATKNPTIIMPCGHTTCGECFQKILEPGNAVQEGNERVVPKCPHCRGTLSSDYITDYVHFCKVFCPEKLDEFDLPALDDDEEESDEESDEDEKDDDLEDFIVPDDADDDYEVKQCPNENPSDMDKKKTRKGKGKGKAPTKGKHTLAELKKQSMRSAAAKRKYLRRLRKEWKSSAKIDKTLEVLADIDANDATEKTLIFSQFTSLLDLLEVPLNDKGIRYQRYDGSMKLNDRADAVNKFMDECEEKVMLISLKAGNAGLNLNKASQVIVLDPFWNPFIEDQAVDRAHRMPQQREVHVHRLLVPETVEDRICQLQDKKRELIDAALDETAANNVSRLSVGDLMYLFGMGNRPQT